MPPSNPDPTDAELVDSFPYVQVDHDTKYLYRGWLERRLLVNRCGDCGHWHHPPKPVCPQCLSGSLEPTEVSGRGVIHLSMLLHQGPRAPGVDYVAGPHPVVTVELEEQAALRITTTLVDGPEAAEIGTPGERTWIERHGSPFPAFRTRGS